MIICFLILLALFAVIAASEPNRINHKGKNLFLNGINVAWGAAPNFCADINFLDPTCQSSDCVADQKYFNDMFSAVSSRGANSMRFWLHADGNPIPVVNGDYSSRTIAPITPTQLASVKSALDLGSKYNILLNLCLWSFDMVNDNGYGAGYGLWNKIVTDETHMNSYIDNWLIPLVKSVKDHYNLLSFEVFNEPEGMITNWGWTNCKSGTSDCARISITQAQKFANRVAAAIHTVSPAVKVTVGSWSYIASSNTNGHTNIWSDAALVAAGGKSNGKLDYYQIHYYNWAYPDNSPFLHSVDNWAASDKPHVIGEFPVNPTGVNDTYIYETLYKKGYAGAWGWCYNCGTDADFNKEVFLNNAQYMQNKYGSAGWPTLYP